MFQIDLENVNERVKLEKMEEITSSFLFLRENEADPEGLASYEIFGMPGTNERKTVFAYINLGDKFVHPHILNALKAIRKDFVNLIMGENDFYLDAGTIVKLKDGEDAPSGKKTGTGASFLYEIWDDLDFNFEEIKVGPRRDRLRLLKNVHKDEAIIDKWIVIPPYYRDVDTASGSKHDLNRFYSRLINTASTIKNSSIILSIYAGLTESHKQQVKNLNIIYEYFINIVGGVHGFIHKQVLGKAIDYSARLVLSAAHFNSDTVEEMDVTFTHSSLPLFATIKCFAPYITSEIRSIVKEYVSGSKFVWSYNPKTGGTSRHELKENWEDIISQDYLMGLIELFHESKEHRLDIFPIETVDGLEVPLLYMTDDNVIGATDGNLIDTLNKNATPITLTHLFYMAAYRRVKDKPIFITRFPTEDYHNIYPSMMNIIPYKNHKPMTVGGVHYPKMPDVKPNDIAIIDDMYTDSLRIFSTYLAALGGDFDGDQVSVYGVHSKEACDEARNYIYSLANIVNIAGSTNRKTGEVVGHTLFNFTKD